MKWEFHRGEGRNKFETREINCITVSDFYYSYFICSCFHKDVLGAVFNFKYVSVMDYCANYASNRLEKARRVSQNSEARLGIFNRIGILFGTAFSFMVCIFKIYNGCKLNDYFSAPANRIFSWRFFLFKERTTYSAVATMGIAILGVMCIGGAI